MLSFSHRCWRFESRPHAFRSALTIIVPSFQHPTEIGPFWVLSSGFRHRRFSCSGFGTKLFWGPCGYVSHDPLIPSKRCVASCPLSSSVPFSHCFLSDQLYSIWNLFCVFCRFLRVGMVKCRLSESITGWWLGIRAAEGSANLPSGHLCLGVLPCWPYCVSLWSFLIFSFFFVVMNKADRGAFLGQKTFQL